MEAFIEIIVGCLVFINSIISILCFGAFLISTLNTISLFLDKENYKEAFKQLGLTILLLLATATAGAFAINLVNYMNSI